MVRLFLCLLVMLLVLVICFIIYWFFMSFGFVVLFVLRIDVVGLRLWRIVVFIFWWWFIYGLG